MLSAEQGTKQTYKITRKNAQQYNMLSMQSTSFSVFLLRKLGQSSPLTVLPPTFPHAGVLAQDRSPTGVFLTCTPAPHPPFSEQLHNLHFSTNLHPITSYSMLLQVCLFISWLRVWGQESCLVPRKPGFHECSLGPVLSPLYIHRITWGLGRFTL